MKAFVLVLIAASLATGLKKNALKFLEAEVKDDYTPDPDGYTENAWDLVWVILCNSIEDSSAVDDVFEVMYSYASIHSLEVSMQELNTYCNSPDDLVFYYAELVNRMASELFNVNTEYQIGNWYDYQALVYQYQGKIYEDYSSFLETWTYDEDTTEDDTDSLSSSIMSEDPSMYADNIIIGEEVYVTINSCDESSEESQGEEEAEEETEEVEGKEDQVEEEIEEETEGGCPKTEDIIAGYKDELAVICI